MKISLLPACAMAFIGLSIIGVTLNDLGVTHLSQCWFAIAIYSALIASAAWVDRHSTQPIDASVPPDDRNDTAGAMQSFDSPNVISIFHHRPQIQDVATEVPKRRAA